ATRNPDADLGIWILASLGMTARLFSRLPSPVSRLPSTIRHARTRHPYRHRPTAQSPWPHSGSAPATTDCDYRPLGLRQKLSRVRHALCRRTAPLHRIAVDLRQAVPGADAQATGGPAGRAGTGGRN